MPLISVPLILEHEAVCKREAQCLNIPSWAVEATDEFILDLAVAGQAQAIVTYNLRHFEGVEAFVVCVLTPREFLRTISAEDK